MARCRAPRAAERRALASAAQPSARESSARAQPHEQPQGQLLPGGPSLKHHRRCWSSRPRPRQRVCCRCWVPWQRSRRGRWRPPFCQPPQTPPAGDAVRRRARSLGFPKKPHRGAPSTPPRRPSRPRAAFVTCSTVSSSTGGRFSPPSPCVASTNAASAASAEDLAAEAALDTPVVITSALRRGAEGEVEAPSPPPPPPPPPSGLALPGAPDELLDDI